MVPHALTPTQLRQAVDRYDFDAPPVTVPDAPQLLLVGEAHGLRAARAPAVLYQVAASLGARAVAFEWSHDELDAPIASFLETGRFDFEAIWALPPSAEVFAGDGRFTAGHFALLERLHGEGMLEQVIAFDRYDPSPPPPWQVRDREMAELLRSAWRPELPLLAVVGAAHAVSEAGTMASELGVEAAMLDYGTRCAMPPASLRFHVPDGTDATDAVVPGR